MDYLQPCGGPGGHLWFHRPLTLADAHFTETLSHRGHWAHSCRRESQKHATFWRNRANQRETRCISYASELEYCNRSSSEIAVAIICDMKNGLIHDPR